MKQIWADITLELKYLELAFWILKLKFICWLESLVKESEG